MRTRRLNQHHTVTERPSPRRPHSGESRASRPLVSPGTQGRTVEDAHISAEALLLCVLGAGLVGLIIALGHLGDAFR